MRPLLAIALALIPACSLFTSLGDFDQEVGEADAAAEGGPPGTTEAGATGDASGGGGGDANVPGDVVDAGTDAGYPNFHPNGSMEFTCQGWFGYNATLASSPTAHGGSASCMVCADKTVADVASIDEGGAVANPVVGGVYVASGWFRVPDGKTSPPGGVKLVFNTKDMNGGTPEYQQTAKISIDGNWKELSVQLQVTKPAAKLRIWAGGTAELGTCFLVDDIRVERRQ